ncbi:ATP-binding protein [Microbacterium sp. SSW1-59]|uniref:sensor histidine kinase n=1 Tax=Microbacterium xanthum TaxID=3079794 RepID=UPI002AD3D565|nr:ATP-binding protein [Microbacterium sp. SSW1-59]MDZ8201306.1 ATP-binding protein [Microbacterium sp. SSW1-59]
MPWAPDDRDVRWRMRAALRGQLPFLLAVLYLVVAAGVAAPALFSLGLVVAGFALVVVASVAAVAVPWERLPTGWLALVPAIDMVAVACLRVEMLSTFGWVGGLSLFPILWFSYGFAWYAIFAAVLGSAFITLLPYLLDQAPPETALQWFNVLGLPVLSVGIGVVTMLAAQRLRGTARATREALQASRDGEILLANVLNTVNAGIVHFDASGSLVASNAHAGRFADLAGIDISRPPYHGPAILAADRVTPIPPDDQIVPRALRGEELDDGIAWIGPPGRQVALVASSRQVRRDDGELLGTVLVVYDVTEIAQAAELREQFLETVSHELKTPMTGILGFLDLLEEETDPGAVKQREYLDVVRRRSADLMDRVREMLAAAESDTPLHVGGVDVAGLVARAVHAVEEKMPDAGGRIAVSAPHEASAEIDGARMSQAVRELIVNAVKFGDPDAPIEVNVAVDDERVRVEVSNRGPDIAAAEQARLYDRFYRAPGAMSRAIQGFGLGLTVVAATADAHGGEVLVDSGDGTTTFTIDIPRAPVFA